MKKVKLLIGIIVLTSVEAPLHGANKVELTSDDILEILRSKETVSKSQKKRIIDSLKKWRESFEKNASSAASTAASSSSSSSTTTSAASASAATNTATK